MRWLKDLFAEGRELLCREYPDARERDSLLNALLEDVLHFPRYASLTDPFREVDERDCDIFLSCARRLAGGEPIQYIVGWTEFCGRRFNVSPSVLIPRPETEQLCMEAVERIRRAFPGLRGVSSGWHGISGGNTADGGRPLRILDLCTGSGCIAWTLALSLPGAEVVGVDISPAALQVALNQDLLPRDDYGGALAPKFVEYDVLRGPSGFDFGEFDVIISNPPYVTESERHLMRRNVLEHEPSLALFVPDTDALRFYRAVLGWSDRLLVPGGLLFFEQNEAYSAQIATICAHLSEVEISDDCFGKPRFTFALK